MKTFCVALFMAGFALSAQAKPTKPPEPEYLKKAHRIEAKAIAATKGMVVRKRGVLTIRYDGKAVAQFTDVRPTEGSVHARFGYLIVILEYLTGLQEPIKLWQLSHAIMVKSTICSLFIQTAVC